MWVIMIVLRPSDGAPYSAVSESVFLALLYPGRKVHQRPRVPLMASPFPKASFPGLNASAIRDWSTPCRPESPGSRTPRRRRGLLAFPVRRGSAGSRNLDRRGCPLREQSCLSTCGASRSRDPPSRSASMSARSLQLRLQRLALRMRLVRGKTAELQPSIPVKNAQSVPNLRSDHGCNIYPKWTGLNSARHKLRPMPTLPPQPRMRGLTRRQGV